MRKEWWRGRGWTYVGLNTIQFSSAGEGGERDGGMGCFYAE
jgi:hypothetical protein